MSLYLLQCACMAEDLRHKNLLEVKGKVDAFIKDSKDTLENYLTHLSSLEERVKRVSDSWSGSWLGFHAFLYYGDFERPPLRESFNVEWGTINGLPAKWMDRTFDEVKKEIEKGVVKHHFDYIFKRVKPTLKTATELRDYICVELSYIKIEESLADEKELVRQLESLEFGTSANKFVNNLKPSQAMTRDSRAAYQGMKVPPHVEYRAQVMAVRSMIHDIQQFNSLSLRLIRQLEIKFQLVSQGDSFVDTLNNIKVICNKFHSVTLQLRRRYSDRTTLDVTDEYDVQDLFHALLKLYFEDIRKEENVPSYAGSSSRIDFLLKREKLVVETKKTSIKLKDKEIGEQLILDVAKYRSHPDCKTLMCFIYDPDGRINNPVGLTSDIEKLSTKDLTVIVIINPLTN